MTSEGTANVQPKQALMRALGAKGSALPEAVQTNTQTVQSAAHADMRGTDASIAPELTDTPQGGMMTEGIASLQPKQALTRALGAKGRALPARGSANKCTDRIECRACGHARDGCKYCTRTNGHTPGGDDVRVYRKFAAQ